MEDLKGRDVKPASKSLNLVLMDCTVGFEPCDGMYSGACSRVLEMKAPLLEIFSVQVHLIASLFWFLCFIKKVTSILTSKRTLVRGYVAGILTRRL